MFDEMGGSVSVKKTCKNVKIHIQTLTFLQISTLKMQFMHVLDIKDRQRNT